WKRYQAQEEAQRRADTERDVAEVGNAFDGITEESAYRVEIAAMAEDADSVAEFQDQLIVCQQIDVPSSNVNVDVVEATGKFQTAERHADHPVARCEDADVVERRSIGRDRRSRLANQLTHLLNHRKIHPDKQEHVVRLERHGWIRHAILTAAADCHDLDAARQTLLKIHEATPDDRRIAHADLGGLHQPIRWGGNLRFEDGEIDVHAEDRSGHAQGIRQAVTDGGVLGPERV